MWYVCDVLYAVLYVRVSCFVVRGCGVSRRYIDVCYCDMFSVVNVYELFVFPFEYSYWYDSSYLQFVRHDSQR